MSEVFGSFISQVEKHLGRNRTDIDLQEYFDLTQSEKAPGVFQQVAGGEFFGGQPTTTYFNDEDVDYIYDQYIVKKNKVGLRPMCCLPPLSFGGVTEYTLLNWAPYTENVGLVPDIGVDYKRQTIGLWPLAVRKIGLGEDLGEKLSTLLFFMSIDYKDHIVKLAGYPDSYGGIGQDKWNNTLGEILSLRPEIVDKNVDNFRDYYGFEAWDKKVVEILNSQIDVQGAPSSGRPLLVKSLVGAAIKKDGKWSYHKPGGEELEDKFKIDLNRIDFFSNEMWWQGEFSHRPFNQPSPPGDNNSALWFAKPLSKQEKSIDTRFNADVGFSKLEFDGQETGESWWSSPYIFQPPETRKSRDWWTRDFAPEFIKLVTWTGDGYTYTSTAADALLKSSVEKFLLQKVFFNDIEGTRTASDIRIVAASLIMNAFREDWWRSRSTTINGFPPSASDEEIQAALDRNADEDFEAAEDAADDATEGVIAPPEDDDAERLSEDEIKRRNLVLKQCALMTNLASLQTLHLDEIVNGGRAIHKKKGKFSAYRNRFYMIKDEMDDADTVNKLLIPPYSKIQHFIEMKPEVHAHLIPKIRLFRVDKNKSTGELSQFEFVFPKKMNATRVNNLKKVGYDRGAEFGIKDFSLSFNGTNPATARNDVEAKLSLYFQTFNDFIVRRPMGGGEDMAFVDLILHPDPDPGESINAAHPDYYTPKNYRIKVDVGWELSSIEGLNYPAPHVTELKEALQKTNKSFYLNRIDESIKFRDDGSVDIEIDYRAYAETATKGTNLDALSNYESRRARREVREDYLKVVNSANCSPDQLARIQNQLEQMEELIKRQSFQSIYKRLLCNGSMRFTKIDEESANRSFRLGRFDRAVKLTHPDFSSYDLELTKDYTEISYFFLGDLIYVILDSLYQENDPDAYVEGAEKFKFILSSFKFEDPFKPGQIRTINLASIPVVTELFKEWFTDNVLKSDRTSYPIMFFIRDLCKYLITEILTESCFKKSLDKRFDFTTMSFVGLANEKGGCRMAEMYPSKTANSLVADVNSYYGDVLPLLSDNGGSNNIKDLYNYIMIFPSGPKIALQDSAYKVGNRLKDGQKGIFHYQIGKDRGLVKKMNFSKTDISFLREARYLNNGFDGLMQLASRYSVTLEMIGNTLYYPGMQIYIDPVGFLGANNGEFNPSVFGSIANKLGFGGYHIITKVNSSISPGKFTTKIEALFDYSGDGTPQARYGGVSEKTKVVSDSSAATPVRTNCANIIDHIELNALEIAEGRADKYSRITDELINEAAAGGATPAASTPPEEAE